MICIGFVSSYLLISFVLLGILFLFLIQFSNKCEGKSLENSLIAGDVGFQNKFVE